MKLERIEFGSLLSYSPHGEALIDLQSQSVMYSVKQDEFVKSFSGPPVLMSTLIAQSVGRRMKTLPFAHLFANHPLLVPTPSSSLKQAYSLDVPLRIAAALGKELGLEVAECLKRVTPLPKSATSAASNRSKTSDHFESLEVQKTLKDPTSILLIGDAVTRGATLLGAANRLAATYSNCSFAAFAALRTVGNPREFTTSDEAVCGYITLHPNGGTLRRP